MRASKVTAEEAAAERAAAIKRIVDRAPPLSAEQISALSRIFAGSAERIRAHAAEKADAIDSAA
ncbi:hypothetical protein [Acrocarpospora sp. B8E8]|uniref:hypothetical protein n=1 Tax=Acrocarpospora sp. B8E8 TaxID=3153572 RepID=UPI00325D8733